MGEIMESYTCENCREYVTEDSVLDEYGNDEDMLVEIGSSGLCPVCYENAIDQQAVYPNRYDLMGEY